jgi:hypothetical protein
MGSGLKLDASTSDGKLFDQPLQRAVALPTRPAGGQERGAMEGAALLTNYHHIHSHALPPLSALSSSLHNQATFAYPTLEVPTVTYLQSIDGNFAGSACPWGPKPYWFDAICDHAVSFLSPSLSRPDSD